MVVTGAVVKVKQIITFGDELLEYGYDPIIHAHLLRLTGEFSIHIPMCAPVIQEYRVKIRPRTDSKVSPKEAHVGIEIGGETPPQAHCLECNR